MALTTTVGGASSDSYATLADYTARATALGWTLAGTDAANEINLRKATVYLDANYVWVGTRVASTQALDWPRISNVLVDGYVIDSDTIPQAVKDAQMELAYLIQGGLNPFATVTNGAVGRKRSKAGPVETETEYATTRETPRIVAIEGLLAPYGRRLASAAAMVRG